MIAVGDIPGTSVYAHTGDVTAEVGGAAWVPFLAAFLIAAVTALSYLELVTKYPHASGAVVHAHKAFGVQFVTFLVAFGIGWGNAGIVIVSLLFMVMLAVNLRGDGERVKLNVALSSERW